MIKTDMHMHTSFSADSDAPMEEMIKASIDKGLRHITFTEHLDEDFPPKYGLDFTFDIDEYFAKVNELKEKYKEKIEILYGIELGVMPHLTDSYNSLVDSYDFDFVIASSHLVDMQDPYYPQFWENNTFHEGCRKYFKTISDNINAFKNFDSYGHLDYIIRYGTDEKKISYLDYSDILDEILLLLINNNKALEINTAGYKYGLNAPNPSAEIITRYLELGGKLFTIGSDAHKPEHIAYDYVRLEAFLKMLGVKEYVYYTKRKPVTVPL